MLAALAVGPMLAELGKGETREARGAAQVLGAALSYGLGGKYDKSWSSSGVPEEVRHAGQRILSASSKGTYCCGFTFAVAMKVLAERGALEGKSAAELRTFQKAWYGASSETAEKQCAVAVESLGVGREIAADDARVGDFAQIWRKSDRPSGHSVLFLAWVREGKQRTGISYLSSQGSTDGIGFAVEHLELGDARRRRVDPERIYFARLDD